MWALVELKEQAALGTLAQVKSSGLDPALAKTAEGAMGALRDAGGLPPEVKALRTELDKLTEESKELKQRLEKLESREPETE